MYRTSTGSRFEIGNINAPFNGCWLREQQSQVRNLVKHDIANHKVRFSFRTLGTLVFSSTFLLSLWLAWWLIQERGEIQAPCCCYAGLKKKVLFNFFGCERKTNCLLVCWMGFKDFFSNPYTSNTVQMMFWMEKCNLKLQQTEKTLETKWFFFPTLNRNMHQVIVHFWDSECKWKERFFYCAVKVKVKVSHYDCLM